MSLKDVEVSNVLRRLADKRIEDAMAEGKFDNLAGMGKPLDLEPMPADENAPLGMPHAESVVHPLEIKADNGLRCRTLG